MTEQHPLTDAIIRKNFTPDYDHFEGLGEICLGFSEDDLRSVMDRQLEDVTAWLKGNLGRYEAAVLGYEDKVIADLKKAMRPQEES